MKSFHRLFEIELFAFKCFMYGLSVFIEIENETYKPNEEFLRRLLHNIM